MPHLDCNIFDYSTNNFHNELFHLKEIAINKKNDYEQLALRPKWEHLSHQFKKTSILKEDFIDISNGDDNSWAGIMSENTTSLSGDRVMKRLQFILDNIPGIDRHEYQIQFHQEILMALLPKIYQKEWAAYSSIILQKYNIKKYRPERLFCTPRRFGKTTSVVVFIIAALYCIPNITTAIFATGKRTAGKLKNQVTKYLRQMPNFTELCFVNNSEKVELHFGPNDIRTMECYPGTVSV
jgi:hypothetical protein